MPDHALGLIQSRLQLGKSMNKIILTCIALVCSGPSQAAETIKVKWDGNYPYNKSTIWDKNKPALDRGNIFSAWTKNFKNGSPQEWGAITTTGVLNAELYKPLDVGTFPYVVFMHGCTGMTTVVKEWIAGFAKTLNEHHIGLLAVDSFTTRYVDDSCGNPDPYWGRRRADDAASALDYLVNNKLAKQGQVFVMGQSNGALSAIMAVNERIALRRHQFKAAIALEPQCGSLPMEKFIAPIFFILAEDDNVTPPQSCIELAKRRSKHPMQVLVMRGATHSYMYKQAGGRRVSTDPNRFGWVSEYNEEKSKILVDTILTFLRNQTIEPKIEYR